MGEATGWCWWISQNQEYLHAMPKSIPFQSTTVNCFDIDMVKVLFFISCFRNGKPVDYAECWSWQEYAEIIFNFIYNINVNLCESIETLIGLKTN